MRNALVQIVQFTYSSLPSEELQSYLGMTSSEELVTYASTCREISEIKEGNVTMTPCPENQPRQQYLENSLRFDEALRLVDAIRSTRGV